MTPRLGARRWMAVLFVCLCAAMMRSVRTPALNDSIVARVGAQGPDLGTEAQRESGKTLYLRYCSQCHGENGDGQGYATAHLSPRPRDFTIARFKVRSTPSGSLPAHQDLIDIIRRGMPYTSMPGWPDLSEQDVSNLAYYIKTFSANFATPEYVPQPMEFPDPPAATQESIELGQKLYVEIGCLKCHGDRGRGDGPSASTLTDDFGHPIRAADLTQPWTFRGGSSREEIFRTMTTGFNGTPMPSFVDSMTPEQRWAISDFIVSLSESSEPGYTNLVVAKSVLEPIDLARGVANFESAPAARFPILGQVTEPGRAFNSPATSLSVRAVYDTESVALLVQWHDMRADNTGMNGPMLPVPPEEEQVSAPAAQAPDAADPFAQDVAAPPAQDVDPFAQDVADPFADDVAGAGAPPSEFSDAVAIQIPAQPTAGARKPYFIFGDAQNAVDLWFFDLARPEPLQFTGRGSADVAANDTGDLTGIASYDQGEWSVIFRRPLRVGSGAPFAPGQFVPVAFSVWDGFSRERGNRRGLTVWQSLYLEPEVVPSAVGPMVRIALLILAIELVVIGWVRWHYGAGARRTIGGDPSQPAATRA